MAKYLRISYGRIVDTTRIIEVAKSNSYWWRLPLLQIKHYDEYEYNDYCIKPMWYWSNIRFESIEIRDLWFDYTSRIIAANTIETLRYDKVKDF